MIMIIIIISYDHDLYPVTTLKNGNPQNLALRTRNTDFGLQHYT